MASPKHIKVKPPVAANVFAALTLPDYAELVQAQIKNHSGRQHLIHDDEHIPEETYDTLKKVPITDEYLKKLLEWHKEKEGFYPTRLDKTPVWVKTCNTWSIAEDCWSGLDDVIRFRSRGMKTSATTLREFKILHRLHDQPVISEEHLRKFLHGI